MSAWLNLPISRRYDLRRIDIILVLFAIFIALFYWLFYSWQWAVLGVLMYTMVLMVALWLL